MRRRKQITEGKEQYAGYDDLQQDQRPILCRNSERNLIVGSERHDEA